jgi:hypothetical protein
LAAAGSPDGPFSRTVADVLMDGVDEEVIVEHHEKFSGVGGEERMLYSYTPGANVDEYAADLDKSSRQVIGDVLEHTKKLHWRALELAATVHYIQKAEGLSRDLATERALALKPPCSPYRKDAAGLLRALEL